MALIFVIDDHAPTNEVLCKLLQMYGHRTASAFTGEGALAMIGVEKPDLIILDQMMPGMDGIEVLRLLRANQDTALIPVILYSAIADPMFAEHAKNKGATAVWMKGQLEPAHIPAMVSDLLSRSAA